MCLGFDGLSLMMRCPTQDGRLPKDIKYSILYLACIPFVGDTLGKCKMGCKVYMGSYMASNGSYFVVTWIIFINHLLEIGLPQNRETMELQNHTIVSLLCLSSVGTPHG